MLDFVDEKAADMMNLLVECKVQVFEGFDQHGFNWRGRDKDGYNKQGFDKKGSHQLHNAAMKEDFDKVRALLDQGVPVDIQDKRDGWTALQWASFGGKDAVAKK